MKKCKGCQGKYGLTLYMMCLRCQYLIPAPKRSNPMGDKLKPCPFCRKRLSLKWSLYNDDDWFYCPYCSRLVRVIDGNLYKSEKDANTRKEEK